MSDGTGGQSSARPSVEDSEFNHVLDEFARRFDRADWVEVAATVVLSLAVLLTAWSAYQAARWSGVQSINASQYAGHLIESSEIGSLIETQMEIDSQATSAWLIMAAEDNQRGMQVLEERFSDMLAPAFEAWIAGSDGAVVPPGLPEDLPQYEEGFEELLEAKSFEFASATEASETAAEANSTSDRYVLVTVVMASVMFVAGIGAKLRGRRIRLTLLAVAGLLCVVAIAAILSLPQQPVEF